MVKVQKHKPKSINKLKKVENVIKKQSTKKHDAAEITAKPKDKSSEGRTVPGVKILASKKTAKKIVEAKLKNVKKITPNTILHEPVKKPSLAKKVKAVTVDSTKSIVAKGQVFKKAGSDNKREKIKKRSVKKVLNTEKQQLTKQQLKKTAKRSFKKLQLKKKREAKPQKAKKSSVIYEPQQFDEEKFQAIVNSNSIEKIATALKTQVEEEVKKKKMSIFGDYRYFLNVACFKIPNCPHRVVKLNLEHSLVDKDDDVAIIVTDLQRGAKVDYEPTIQHYEDLFREGGIEGLTIVPFNKLRTEVNSFETKRKFCNTYDYFLCDGRLVGQVHGFIGKTCQKPRNIFHSVRMDNAKNLKQEIERSLCRTAYKQLHKGDLISIPVGNHKFTIEKLVENIICVTEQLKKLYPGGLGNIRSMHLKIDILGTSSIPLYISLSQPPGDAPYVVGQREQRMLKLKKEANEVLSKFTITKDANIIKLNSTQIERKRQMREALSVVLADKDNTSIASKKTREDNSSTEKTDADGSADEESNGSEHDHDGNGNEESDENIDDDSDEEEDEDSEE